MSDPLNLSGIRSVAVSGHYAYTPSYLNGELTTVDISNPAAPTIVGETAPPAGPAANALYNADFITISGGYAYVTSKNANSSTSQDNGLGNGLTIFSLANPAQPTWVGFISDASTSHTNLFGAYGVAVSGSFAYVAAQGCLGSSPTCPSPAPGNDVDVIDISNPSTPTEATQVTNPTGGQFTGALSHADGIAISGNFAYVTATSADALTVISLDQTTPGNDAIVGELADSTHFGFLNDVAVSGGYAYLANGGTSASGSLAVVNISNPAQPSLTSDLTDTRLGGAYRVVVNGSVAYVAADQADAISAIDISNPAAPTIVSSIGDSAHLHHTSSLGLALAGRYVVAASPFLSTETQVNSPPYPYPYPGGNPCCSDENTGTISVIDMDPNPMSVNITTPSNGATYLVGQSVIANYACTSSGVAAVTSCSGPVASGTPVSTRTLGSHTFTVSGQDTFGQTGSASVTYTVVAPPAAAFTAKPSPGVAGAPVSFDGSSSSDPNPGATITGYAWSFGDGSSGTGAHATHTYAKRGTYSVTLTVTDSVHQTASTSHLVVVGLAPRLTHVGQTARKWREHGKAGKHKPPVGTAFTFTLNENAKVTLTFTRLVGPGRKVGKRCVVQNKSNRHHRACTRTAPAGTLTFNLARGANKIRFNGKIKGKYLKPGTYTVTITATAYGVKVSRTMTFTILA